MHFVSFWALIAHALSIIGILPSTLGLAVFTLGGSLFHNMFVNTSYSLVHDIVIHYIPVLLMYLLKREVVLWPIFVVYTLFFISWRWDFRGIFEVYSNNKACF